MSDILDPTENTLQIEKSHIARISLIRNIFRVIKLAYFSHLFLISYWNLTKRSENFVDLKVRQIKFSNYALVFEFFKSKGHHTVEDNICPFYVHANPLCP